MLAIIWSLFVVVIIATYTANLTAFLTVSQSGMKISSLSQLMSTNLIPIIEAGSSYVGLFSVSCVLSK